MNPLYPIRNLVNVDFLARSGSSYDFLFERFCFHRSLPLLRCKRSEVVSCYYNNRRLFRWKTPRHFSSFSTIESACVAFDFFHALESTKLGSFAPSFLLRPMNFHLFGDRICPGRILVGAHTFCGPTGSDTRMVGGAWAAFGSRGILFAAHPVLASRRFIPLGPHSGRGTHLLRPNGFRCPNGWRGLGRIGAHRAG